MSRLKHGLLRLIVKDVDVLTYYKYSLFRIKFYYQENIKFEIASHKISLSLSLKISNHFPGRLSLYQILET